MRYDAVVVGGGLAGLMSALELRPLRVALVAPKLLGEGTASAWAQGGIAAAVGADDSPAFHAADTVAAGAGLVEERVAARLAADAPHAIERVTSLGVRFDREGEDFALGREARAFAAPHPARGRRRDRRRAVRALVAAVREAPHVEPIEDARALDVILREGCACGVVVRHADGRVENLYAGAVVLATGGLCGLYRYTTNPPGSRGAGCRDRLARRRDAGRSRVRSVPSDGARRAGRSASARHRGVARRRRPARRRTRHAHHAGRRSGAGTRPARRRCPPRLRGARSRRPASLDARGARSRSFPNTFRRSTPLAARTASIRCTSRSRSWPRRTTTWAASPSTSTAGPRFRVCTPAAKSPRPGVHGANRLASNSLLESVVYPERIANDARAFVRVAPRITEEAPAEQRPDAAGSAGEWSDAARRNVRRTSASSATASVCVTRSAFYGALGAATAKRRSSRRRHGRGVGCALGAGTARNARQPRAARLPRDGRERTPPFVRRLPNRCRHDAASRPDTGRRTASAAALRAARARGAERGLRAGRRPYERSDGAGRYACDCAARGAPARRSSRARSRAARVSTARSRRRASTCGFATAKIWRATRRSPRSKVTRARCSAPSGPR